MDLKLKAKFDTLRIEALENELSKITNASAEVIEELKSFKETAKISIQTLTQIIMDKDEVIANQEMKISMSESINKKNIKDLKKRFELKEGQFISSQKVVEERGKTIDCLIEDLRISKCHVDNREDQQKGTERALDMYKEKARLARKDAEYWANEAAKFEINCNNCNL